MQYCVIGSGQINQYQDSFFTFFKPIFNVISQMNNLINCRATGSKTCLCGWQGCGSGSAKNLPPPLPHRLFDLKSTWRKSFVRFAMWIKR